jgi:hypothetical protein
MIMRFVQKLDTGNKKLMVQYSRGAYFRSRPH